MNEPPAVMPNRPGSAKWYDPTWVLVVSLLFCFPVGLFVVWRRPGSRNVKIAITVAVAVVLVGAAAASGSTKSNAPAVASAPDAATAKSTIASTVRPKRVAAPAPTTSATVAPTTTATAPPTTRATTPPTTSPPAVITIDGTGDRVVDLKKPKSDPSSPVTLHVHYGGGSNFAVKGLDSGLQDTDLFVNTIGAFDGTVAVDFSNTQTAKLQVTASGPWHIDVKNAEDARTFTGATTGLGDDVLLYSGSGGVAAITNQGTENFVVEYYSRVAGGSENHDLLVNEIGSYNGQQPMAAGPGFVVVTSDGRWSVNVAPS